MLKPCSLPEYSSIKYCGGDKVTLLWFITLGPCEHDRDLTIVYYFIKFDRHVNNDKKMIPIDFEDQRSRSGHYSLDIYGNKLVNTMETKPCCISSSNLADMLTLVRG